MDTLDTIIQDLATIASNKGYTGATVEALIYLMASGIYKNQLNVVNVILESSGAKCTLLNSAIQHAQDKMFSVKRGTNQHFKLEGIIPIDSFEVKKYDICQKIGKYKLIYAQDYSFSAGTSYTIELILCTTVISEYISASNKKYIRSTNSDISDDIAFYVDDEETTYATSICIDIGNTQGFLNKNVDSPYLIITDTDYSVIIWIYDGSDSTKVFDTNNSFRIQSPQYLEDTLETTKIKNIKEFDLTSTTITSISNELRESDVSNIFLDSCVSDKSGNVIRSINDVKDIFLTYMGRTNIRNSNVYINKEYIKIYYLKQNLDEKIDDETLAAFKKYIENAYYVNQEFIVDKATKVTSSSYVKTSSPIIGTEYYTFIKYDDDATAETEMTCFIIEQDADGIDQYIKITKAEGESLKNCYYLSKFTYSPYSVVENPVIGTTYYDESHNKFVYDPFTPADNPVLGNAYWQYDSETDTWNNVPYVPLTLEENPVVGKAYWQIKDKGLTKDYTVIYCNDAMFETTTDPETGETVTKLLPIYVLYNRNYSAIAYNKKDITCYSFEDKDCYIENTTSDLNITIYFDGVIDSTAINNFMDSYKYNIGITWKPMKIISELMTKFSDTVTWVDINSSKAEKTLRTNEFFDYTYSITYLANSNTDDDNITQITETT